jgi:hypothetical protein
MSLPEQDPNNLDADVILMLPTGLEFPARDKDSDDSDFVGQLRVDVQNEDDSQGHEDIEES